MEGIAVAALVVLAVVSLLWTIALAFVVFELRRALWRVQEFIRSVEMELKPTMQEAREAIHTLQSVAQNASESTERIRNALRTLERAGEHVRLTAGAVRGAVGSRLIPMAGLMAGLRAGAKVLWGVYSRRRERA